LILIELGPAGVLYRELGQYRTCEIHVHSTSDYIQVQ